MKVGVMGAGAVGCYVGGRLAARGGDVLLVGRERLRRELAETGLTLTELSKPEAVQIAPGDLRFETDPGALRDREVVLVAVKSGQTADVGAQLGELLADGVVVVSLQNGLGNADVLKKALPRQLVLAGIVGFNVVWKERGSFRQATSGPLVIEAPSEPDPRVEALARSLESAGFETELARDIRALQWSKLVINLNNAVSALTDVPTTQLVFDRSYRRILAAIMGEALGVLNRAGIRPGRLGPLPPSVFPLLLKLPTWALRALMSVQMDIDPEARSSMWEDLTRRRKTEVDELNGAIVELARANGFSAPMNERIVELVHAAEERAAGSPKTSAETLWRELCGGA